MKYARDNPITQAFLEAILALCRQHNLSLSHEDSQGGFEIESYSEHCARWLLQAADRTQPDEPEPFTDFTE